MLDLMKFLSIIILTVICLFLFDFFNFFFIWSALSIWFGLKHGKIKS